MKIFEELKVNVNELADYLELHGDNDIWTNMDNLIFLIGVLDKGYSLNKEINDFEGSDLKDIPKAGNKWIERAQDAIAEQIKLAKLLSRADIYLSPKEGVSLVECYSELQKAVEKKEYSLNKINISEPFEDKMTFKEIYDEINKTEWK